MICKVYFYYKIYIINTINIQYIFHKIYYKIFRNIFLIYNIIIDFKLQISQTM